MNGPTQGTTTGMDWVIVVAGGVVIIALWFVTCLTIVHEGTAMVVEAWGKFVRTVGPGMHAVFWPSESVKRVTWTTYNTLGHRSSATWDRISTTMCTLDIPPVKVVTKVRTCPCASPTTPLVCRPWSRQTGHSLCGDQGPDCCQLGYYQVDAKQVHTAVYSVPDLTAAIEQFVSTRLREVAAETTLDDLTHVRDVLKKLIPDGKLEWGLCKLAVVIQSVRGAEHIMKASESAMVVQRQSEAERIAQRTRFQVEQDKLEHDQKMTQRQLAMAQERHEAQVKRECQRYKVMNIKCRHIT